MTVKRVILFVVDGMRPDGMLQARTPTMRRLMENGAYTLQAQTVMPSITLPVHMSMFHGVPPESHGVVTNRWQPMPDGQIPGIMDVVRQARRSPVVFYSWEPLRDLARPGALVHSSLVDIYWPVEGGPDAAVARLAGEYLASHAFDFAFVYLGATDEVGHRHGWMSPEYLDAIAGADEAMAFILSRLEQAGLMDTTAVLLLSDHGGHERAHGSDSPEDMNIPWIMSGPGVRRDYVLTQPVCVIDTAPTAAYLLGLEVPPAWQGRAVIEGMEETQ